MEQAFLSILNMSMTASYIIVVIMLVRLPLKKAPKIISYALWAVAGFRLVFPFKLEGVFSLLPFKAAPIPQDIAMQAVPRIDSGIAIIDNAVSASLPAAVPYASANPLQIWIFIGSCVWLIGAALMLLYSFKSAVSLKHSLRSAAHIDVNLYEAHNLKTPFVIGLFKPKIFIPADLPVVERRYIILHEQLHIRRYDHIVKILAYLILCMHWFNPLAWAAFILMSADMEMSCDERVMRELGGEIKSAYSLSLVRVAAGRRILSGSPLAFGEGGMKERIKNVLSFKKHSRVIIILAVALVTVLSVGLAVNRSDNIPLAEMKIVYEENPASFLSDMKLIWDDTAYHEIPMSNSERGREIGYATDENSTWRIFELKGHGHDYLLAAESEDVWRVMSVNPPKAAWRQYILENATENQKLMKLLSITLYSDGTAMLATPPISSYSLSSPYYYTFTDGELLIHYERDNIIARFTVVDDSTLMFKSATVPLFADEGASYIFAPSSAVPATAFVPRKWVDFYLDPEMPWTSTFDLMLDEFPGVVFSWTSNRVTATDSNGVRELFGGMPVWSVYLADLNDDALPELCATVSIGSGFIDTRITVCDFANDKLFDLSDRMYYDYSLSIVDNRLVVTQTEYSGRSSTSTGSLSIEDDELLVSGIDRTPPESEAKEASPTEASIWPVQSLESPNDSGASPHTITPDYHRLIIGGYGDAYLAYSPSDGDMYIAGALPIAQLDAEKVEGSAMFMSDDADTLVIRLTVSRPDLSSGTVMGPQILISYNSKYDRIDELVCEPFINSAGEQFTFDLSDENALDTGRLLSEALSLCREYAEINR